MSLAEIRKSKGLSQRQLAEVSGVNASRIADIERGRRDIRKASFATAVRLADALKLKDLRKLLEP
ncbi:MAG: helix-turn-helix transcriptional regulator [Bifidobacterium castoris]|nr:helix-turn-helix transcriptional regulator [Bifidobacterium castoris]